MAFQLIAVKQSKPFTLTSQASPLSVSLDSAVTLGSTIVVMGAGISSDDTAALLGTVSGGSATWGASTNTRASGAGLPNVFAAVGVSAAAGLHTFLLPFTVDGAAATDFRCSGVIMEVEKVPTASVVDKVVPGTSSNATSTSTSATGTLAQTDNLLLLCAGGWFGVPQLPSGWTAVGAPVTNGTYIGSIVCSKKVTATTTQTGSVAHDTAPEASAIMLVLKAADDSAYYYECKFPATGTGAMPSAQANLKAVVARNFDPFASSGTLERYTGLTAESGTAPGDSTSRRVLIASGLPSGLSVSDTLRVSFESNDASFASVGWVPGEVKAV